MLDLNLTSSFGGESDSFFFKSNRKLADDLRIVALILRPNQIVFDFRVPVVVLLPNLVSKFPVEHLLPRSLTMPAKKRWKRTWSK